MQKNGRGKQKILVFQQHQSGESKIQGIKKCAPDLFDLEVISINSSLPPFIDDPETYLPSEIQADLVLDFLKHEDLSYELALKCSREGIPLIAKGKSWRISGVLTPPT